MSKRIRSFAPQSIPRDMEQHQRKFTVSAWLREHGHDGTAWFDEEYRWIWADSIYRYYLDTYGGQHPLTKVAFGQTLGKLNIRQRRTQWGRQWQINLKFDIPEHYLAPIDEAVIEKKRLHNEKRRK